MEVKNWTPGTVIMVGIAIIVGAVLLIGGLQWYARYEKCVSFSHAFGGSSSGCASFTAP